MPLSSWRQSVPFSSVVPFLVLLAGLALSVWRFRDGDPVGGLACSLAGVVLMMGIAMRLPEAR
jgi:hypothetical protein